MSEPLFVTISDIHFNINNLDLATKALETAFEEAYSLEIPLIIAGDLHDTKAIIRAEVMNRLLTVFKSYKKVESYVLVGNHDFINEKGHDHGLNYLSNLTHVVDTPQYSWLVNTEVSMLPYTSNKEELKQCLAGIAEGIIVCHQGVLGAYMGDYVQDKTSISSDEFRVNKVFSGHYHRHQTAGKVTYLGSPFTHTWGEANDGDKGFLIVNSDGSFTRKTLNLRKHIVYAARWDNLDSISSTSRPEDLVKIKISGPKSELDKLEKKRDLIAKYAGRLDFKLEFIVDEKSATRSELVKQDDLHKLLDSIIDELEETKERKSHLKERWRVILP